MRERLHDAALNLAAHPVAWPLARLARRVRPVIRVPGLGIVVSDASFAHDVLVRDEQFTKNGARSFASTMTELLGPFALGNMDGEAHRLLRNKLADVVSPGRVAELLRACDTPLAMLRDDLSAGRTVDLVEWMRRLSGRLTFDMLGVAPPAGREDKAYLELVALGERIASGFDFRRPSARRLRAARLDCDRLAEYAQIGFDSPAAPEKSFVRRLRDQGLSFEEARGVISLIFLAGTLTTASALPRIVALLIDGHHIDRLREHPEMRASAIAEGLRYTTPVGATIRIARAAVELGGHRILAGERIIILTCNLARDKALFPEPDSFDPARVQPPHARNLWFGAGPHFCLGFAVAQRELAIVLDALLSGQGELQIVRRRAAHRVIIPAYARLDVRSSRPG